MGHGSHQQLYWSTVERHMEGGQWTDQKFDGADAIPIPPLPFEGEREFREKESPSETSTSSEPRLDVQAAMQSRTKEHRHTQSVAGSESKNVSETLRMDQKCWIEDVK